MKRGSLSSALRTDLFGEPATDWPQGFDYRPEAMPATLERELVARFEALPFEAFDFHGFKGHRQVVYFGWRYDFSRGRIESVEPIPGYLDPVRFVAASLAGVSPADLVQVLINRYPPGAGIGWHRDRPQFGKIVGVSLGASAPFRFRRAKEGGWDRRTVRVEARSAYLLDGEARDVWEHSLNPVEALRYSITLRTLKSGRGTGSPSGSLSQGQKDIEMDREQTQGREKNGAHPGGKPDGLTSDKAVKETGGREAESAGPDGPDASVVGETFKKSPGGAPSTGK